MNGRVLVRSTQGRINVANVCMYVRMYVCMLTHRNVCSSADCQVINTSKQLLYLIQTPSLKIKCHISLTSGYWTPLLNADFTNLTNSINNFLHCIIPTYDELNYEWMKLLFNCRPQTHLMHIRFCQQSAAKCMLSSTIFSTSFQKICHKKFISRLNFRYHWIVNYHRQKCSNPMMQFTAVTWPS